MPTWTQLTRTSKEKLREFVRGTEHHHFVERLFLNVENSRMEAADLLDTLNEREFSITSYQDELEICRAEIHTLRLELEKIEKNSADCETCSASFFAHEALNRKAPPIFPEERKEND